MDNKRKVKKKSKTIFPLAINESFYELIKTSKREREGERMMD